MDWNNVVAAGGSVLAAIHPPPPGPLRDFYHTLAYRLVLCVVCSCVKKSTNQWFAKRKPCFSITRRPPIFAECPPFRASDVDLFLYGLDEQQATEKVKQIFAAVKLANPKVGPVNDAVVLSRAKYTTGRCRWFTIPRPVLFTTRDVNVPSC